MARGNERQKTFRDDEDRRRFPRDARGNGPAADGLRLHGFCLMPNHHHLLLETPRANLSRAVGWLQTTYTIRFNHRHRRSGHLFQGRFKAQVVEADSYAMELRAIFISIPCVHGQDRAGAAGAPRSSVRLSVEQSSGISRGGNEHRACTDWLSYFDRTRPEAVRGYGRFVGQAFGKALDSPWDGLKLGLVLGGETLVKRVKELLKKKPNRKRSAGWRGSIAR